MADDQRIAHEPTEIASGKDSPDKKQSELLEAGERAGDYEVVRHIGGGAMGDVYEGIHRAIGKRVAIKVIKYALADSEEAASRFVREARAVNQIDHPNVLDVFAFGHLPGGRPYLVMDLLEGRSLGARLRSDGPLGIPALLDILEGVCLALDAAHERGVVHRDLKPDNVFLGDEEGGRRRVFVLDFGIAKVLSDAAAETGKGTLTGEGVWIGTPAYMAPEQWTAEGASARSDVYALGAMAYEMLSGRAPYRADSVPAIMEQHFHAEVPALEAGEGRAALPREVGEAIRKAMAKKPEDRYGGGGDFLTAMQAACRALPRKVPGDRTRVPTPALLLGGALGVGVIGLTALLLLGGDLLGKFDGGATPAVAEDPEPSEPAPPAPDEPTAQEEVMLRLEVTPAGSRIEVNGEPRGTSTPAAILGARPGEALEVRLSHPGCLARTLQLEATEDEEVRRVALEAVEDFAGTWSLPGGDELRHLSRDGQTVQVDAVDPRTGARAPHQRYVFIDAPDGAVMFETSTAVTEPEAPEAASCRRSLRTQYRYWPADKRLELRTERDQVVVEDGACQTLARSFRPWEILERHWSGEAPRGNVQSPRKNAEARKKNLARKKRSAPPRSQKKEPLPVPNQANAPPAKQQKLPPAQQAAPAKTSAASRD